MPARLFRPRGRYRIQPAAGDARLGSLVVHRVSHLRPLDADHTSGAMPVHPLFT